MTIEYSANLDRQADMARLCSRLLDAILSTGLFEIGAVRVRAFRAEAFAIADQASDNAFVDLNFRIGRGRTIDEKRQAGEVIFAVASEELAPLFETPHFALSLEIREIDAELSWKRNTLHARLRNQ